MKKIMCSRDLNAFAPILSLPPPTMVCHQLRMLRDGSLFY